MSTDTQSSAPDCPFPCGWKGLHKIAAQDAAYLAKVQWPEDEEGVSVPRATAMRSMDYLIQVCRTMLNSAPVAAQAQPPKLTPDELESLHDFQRTTIDDSCHTLDKPMIKRLTSAGALESMGFGKHRLTEYGEWLLEQNASAQQPVSGADGLPQAMLPARPTPEASNTFGLGLDGYTGAQMLTYGRACAEAQRKADSQAKLSGNTGELAREFANRIDQHQRTLANIEAFVACDASAISYQSLGQYRTALLRMLRQAPATKEPKA